LAHTERISCSQLQTGMYVSELDRPWLETPFLFQGFEIRSDREIAELKRYCDHVYIDTRMSGLGEMLPRSLRVGGSTSSSPSKSSRAENDDISGGPTFTRLKRLFRAFRGSSSSQQPAPEAQYQDQQPVNDELPLARDVRTRSLDAISSAMTRIREGGSLSVEVIDEVVDPLIDSVLRNHDALVLLTRIAKTDDYLHSHSVGCAVYAIAFGRHLGLDRSQLQTLGTGALLLDVGKTRLPTDLLMKESQLSDEEVALLHTHVELGVEILSATSNLDPAVIEIIRTHHERFDGRGYPEGLTGADIPVYGRIAGIVDHYDAMTSKQPYAEAMSPYDAMRELHKAVDIEFQAEMVEQFIRAIGMFPSGTLVELSSGEIGVVIEQNDIRRLRPKVMIILDRDKKQLEDFHTLNLREFPAEPGMPGAIWIHRGVDAGSYGIDPADYFL
jgi:HD-GYP domain-containing protein (c-di-GMP phosphodiesterase class II)